MTRSEPFLPPMFAHRLGETAYRTHKKKSDTESDDKSGKIDPDIVQRRSATATEELDGLVADSREQSCK